MVRLSCAVTGYNTWAEHSLKPVTVCSPGVAVSLRFVMAGMEMGDNHYRLKPFEGVWQGGLLPVCMSGGARFDGAVRKAV